MGRLAAKLSEAARADAEIRFAQHGVRAGIGADADRGGSNAFDRVARVTLSLVGANGPIGVSGVSALVPRIELLRVIGCRQCDTARCQAGHYQTDYLADFIHCCSPSGD